MELKGKVAVLTGASSGIGWATAVALARAGATVVGSARREERLKELVEGIERRGGTALAVACDVSDRVQVGLLRQRVEDAYGRCDVLVNNAGIPGGGPFAELSLEQIERITQTNYMGVLYCSKAFLPMMLEEGSGHIVNVASLAGRYAVPGSSVYSSTKHAVVAFSEALYYELMPRGIVVTSVNPGLVSTETFPHRDMLEKRPGLVMPPERIGDAIVQVVRKGKGPEVSIPRWLASFQAVRVLAPPLYRFGLTRAVKRGLRATRAGEK
jgi:short-subunit dehydrogenase